MSNSQVVTARISQELSGELDRLSVEVERSRAWIVGKAIERYVREELELIAFIQEGEDDIAAGRIRTQEEVEAMFNVRRTERDAA